MLFAEVPPHLARAQPIPGWGSHVTMLTFYFLIQVAILQHTLLSHTFLAAAGTGGCAQGYAKALPPFILRLCGFIGIEYVLGKLET